MSRLRVALILLLLLLAGPTWAQTVPITQVSERAHVTLNGGAMVLTTGSDWSGASLGAGVGYNLHQKLTVFYGYDHGFPINDVDEDLDFNRVVGSVWIHPNAFAGFGYGWFGDHVQGGLVQLVVQQSVAPRLKLAGLYAHVFADETLNDFEYVRVYLNYHLLGKE